MILFPVLLFTIVTYLSRKESFLKADDELWESRENVSYNNCYAYAFTDMDSSRKTKPQPGFKHNLQPLTRNEFSCQNLIDRVLLDHPDAIFIGNSPDINYSPCGFDHHMIFLAIDNEGENRDYHFYRRNSRGFWTHKPGSTEVYHTDAEGNIITNPYYANRNYNVFQYTIPCGFFCVKTK